MPNYAQVQTYTICSQDTLPTVLEQYRQVLINLGCTNRQVLDWLINIEWPTSDDDGFGDVYAAPVVLVPPQQQPLTCAGIEVSLYAHSAVPSIEDPPSWVGFNLLLDPDLLRISETEPYKPEIGRTLWHILLELFQAFPDLGSYFTEGWQENLAWRALVEQAGDPWIFELAIFPRKLANHFKEVPAGFQGTVIDGAFGFAQANRWRILPWTEAGQPAR